MSKYTENHTPNAQLFLERNYPFPGPIVLCYFGSPPEWLVVSGGGGYGNSDLEMQREILEDMMSTGYYPQAETVIGTLDIVRLLI